MKKHLFLTGPIGCGKSTAIAAALGEKKSRCGGFFTRRYQEPELHFGLETPDGKHRESFLSFHGGKPEIALEAFRPELLTGAPLILDEIGGIELLEPRFAEALEETLQRDMPILGVLKGKAPAGMLSEALNLTDAYQAAASRLWALLEKDPDTLIYECGHFDETARLLAAQWTEEYLHD